MKIDIINQKKEELTKLQGDYKKKSKIFSLGRLLSFLIFIAGLLLGSLVNGFLYIMAIVSIISFIVLAIFHDRLLNQLNKVELKLGALDAYLKRDTDAWREFPDKGTEFLDKKAYYQSDLDLFGQASLYQYLNTAKTPFGRKYVADAIKNHQFGDLKKRQKAISELANNLDLALDIECSGRRYAKALKKNTTIPSIETMGENIKNISNINIVALICAIIGPISLVASLILLGVGVVDYRVLVFVMIFNLASSFIFRRGMNEALENIFDSSLTLDSYLGFLDCLKYEAKEELNVNNLACLSDYQESLKSFHFRASLVNARRNAIVAVLGNGLLQYDFWCVMLYRNWQKKYGSDVLAFIKTIGFMEELNSLAVVERIKENACLPEVSDRISFTNLVHPLLDEKIAVGNDFILKGLDIITGSNMSGKTTFMRTIGLNMILFSTGSFVTGSSFEGFYLKIFTSMRATDDVSQGISTFYAEILRIKEMLGYLDKKENVLVLVDEIFKGTNTIDRICGAKGAIKRLLRPYVYGIIATHDNELCESVLENYHFEEKYDGDIISFDYKIKPGIARTTNAKHLMRLAGIIGEDENE